MGKARKRAVRKLRAIGMDVDGGGGGTAAAGPPPAPASGVAAMDTTDGPPRPAPSASRPLGIAVR